LEYVEASRSMQHEQT